MICLYHCGVRFINEGLQELIVPAIWESQTFLNKLGMEKENQMWTFADKGNRACCLVPEITGIVQEMWRNEWSKNMKGLSLFYIARCYRYDRPQAGRYREFTQVGVELLGEQSNATRALNLLQTVVAQYCPSMETKSNVQRGLSYYVANGFEVEASWLGAQKQVAGGGCYAEGVGWAIGLDRLDLARQTLPIEK